MKICGRAIDKDWLFGGFSTPVSIELKEWKLGLIHKVLVLLALIYPLLTFLWVDTSYRVAELPVAVPTFWFETYGEDLHGNTISLNQALDFEEGEEVPAYCGNTEYDYYYSSRAISYWNDLDLLCRDFDYSEMTHKEKDLAFVATLVKEIRTHMNSGDTCDECVATMDGQRVTERVYRNVYGEDRCRCKVQQDWFALGSEDLMLGIEHKIITTEAMEKMKASSTLTKAESDKHHKRIRTTIRNKGGGKDHTFPPGETVLMAMRDWLEFAGNIDLDERLEAGTVPPSTDAGPCENPTQTCEGVDRNGETTWETCCGTDALNHGLMPHRRVVGGTLSIMLEYEGDVDHGCDGEVDMLCCTIKAEWVDMWGSIGSKVLHETQRELDTASINETYTDRYARGIKVEFYAQGTTTKWNWQVIINTIVAGLVLLNFVPDIVLKIAFTCFGAKSEAFQAAVEKEFCFHTELAKFAANCAIITSMFKQWDAAGDTPRASRGAAFTPRGSVTAGNDDAYAQDGQVSIEELQLVFEGPFSKEEARQFAEIIIREGSLDGDDTLSPREMIGIMSDELVSIDTLIRKSAKYVGAAKEEAADDAPNFSEETEPTKLVARQAKASVRCGIAPEKTTPAISKKMAEDEKKKKKKKKHKKKKRDRGASFYRNKEEVVSDAPSPMHPAEEQKDPEAPASFWGGWF